MKRTSIEIRFTDVDSQDHVNHTAIVEWIAHARVTLIDEKVTQYHHTIWQNLKDQDPELDHVLVNLEVNFHKEVFYPGTIEVSARVLNVGTKSVTTEFFVYSGDEVVAEAHCVNVFFRTNDKKSMDIPDKLKDMMMKKNGCNIMTKQKETKENIVFYKVTEKKVKKE
jgi:YbgC/YbaW family acyl-CoA thioester hydrolase